MVQNKKSEKGIFKYRKIIMLVLILIAVIICISATYITTYEANVVTREDVITKQVTSTYKSSEEFLSNFEKFEIKLTQAIDPYKDNAGTEVLGSYKFKVENKTNESSRIRETVDLKVTAGLGANWIGFKSQTAANNSVDVNSSTATLTIKNIDTIFPTVGPLWFVNVDAPTLYVLVEWSEIDGSQFHTYLEFSEAEYK